ncbi:hypothetical protein AHiyo4_06790 [Arthrobacter sp. Hiyo4]|nr:hypothetical protein AHiyo4_06790 [Arthrobacter sp. Hiyo4]
MPSFQTRLKITGLKPGNPPEAVMAAAVGALETRHHVESNQLELAGGVPQLNLRFLVEPTEYSGENQQARESAAMMRDAVERVALTGALTVLRRSRGRWPRCNRKAQCSGAGSSTGERVPRRRVTMMPTTAPITRPSTTPISELAQNGSLVADPVK